MLVFVAFTMITDGAPVLLPVEQTAQPERPYFAQVTPHNAAQKEIQHKGSALCMLTLWEGQQGKSAGCINPTAHGAGKHQVLEHITLHPSTFNLLHRPHVLQLPLLWINSICPLTFLSHTVFSAVIFPEFHLLHPAVNVILHSPLTTCIDGGLRRVGKQVVKNWSCFSSWFFLFFFFLCWQQLPKCHTKATLLKELH